MPALDDAFLRFLLPLSGQAISFLPGSGGFEDALNGLAFLELCDRNRITCEAFSGSEGEDRTVVVGSVAVASRWRASLGGRRTAVLPGTASRFEDLGVDLDDATTVFWRDRVSLRMAELRGAGPERAVLCHDLAVHLDADGLAPAPGSGTGLLVVDLDGARAARPGDRIRLRLLGGDDRWASLDRCREAVRGVAGLMAHRAEIATDSPGLAILAAKMGKAVRLSGEADRATEAVFNDTILPLYPAVTLDPGGMREGWGHDGDDGAARRERPDGGDETVAPEEDVARFKALLTAARRDAQVLAQERDRLIVAAADARDRRDTETVAVVRSHRDAKRRAEEAERRTADSFADFRQRAADELEAATAAAESRLSDLADRLAAVEGERDAAVDEAATREREARAAAEHDATAREAAAAAREAEARDLAARAAADRETAGREAAAREAALHRRLDELNAAFDARTRQTLSLQSALDGRDARAVVTEARVAQMRALIDARTAAGDEARRDAEALRRRLGDVLSSTSWRVTRPLRVVTRMLRRPFGAQHGGRHG